MVVLLTRDGSIYNFDIDAKAIGQKYITYYNL